MKTKRNVWFKTLASFLVFIMVIQLLPMSVFANDVANNRVLNSIQSTETNYEDLKIVEEITKTQNDYSRTFLLEDGSYCEISSNVLLNNGISQFSLSEDECTVKEMANNLSKITSQSVEIPDIQLNDGLVVQDNEHPLNIYCAELTENDLGDYDWRISDSFPKIQEYAIVLIRPTVADSTKSYNKSQVTLDASIRLTCNSESDVNFDVYVQTFNDKWTEEGFIEEELLAHDYNYDFVNTSGQIYDYNSIDDMGNYVWNITSAYKNWENGTEENNGLFIKTGGTENVYITSGVLLRHYRVIDENDNGFTYHYEDMGRAGTLCINDFTNVPTLLRNELSIDVANMPVSITRSINVGLNNNSFGAAGRWNYSSDLTYSNDTFTWNMIDGSSKRFKRADTQETDEIGREKWVEYLYNGGESVLWVEPSSLNNLPYNFSNNIIVDDENNTNYFNSKNKLVSITSKDNKSVDIEYSRGDNITSITDGAGHKFVFDNNGFIAPFNFVKSIKVLSSNGEEVSFDGNSPLELDYSYMVKNIENANGIKEPKLFLSNVTYPDGKTVTYDYDDFGRLVSITNIDKSKLDIEYYNSNVSKNLNPVYFSRVKSYTKSGFDIETNLYKTLYTVRLNSDDTYRRTKEIVYGDLTKTEFNQYNSNLDVLYRVDSEGNSFYADYDELHNLTSYTLENSNDFNNIKNFDMHLRKPGGKLPAQWDTINLNSTNCSMPKRDNDYCVEFLDSIDQIRGLSQYVDIDGEKDDKYVISAWGKAMAIIPTDERFWGVRILAKDENGVEQIIHEMSFDTSLWGIEQIRKTAFALPFDTKQIAVQIISYNQINKIQFDDIELYKADSSYVASVDDNVTTTCNCSNCTEPNCPCKCENEDVCNCIYCKRGIKTEINANGAIETIKTDGVNSMKSSNAFTSSNNCIANSIDENGVVTYYDYNENTGKLTSFSDSFNNKTDYSYNAIGLLRTVSQTVTNIITGESVEMVSTYTYDGDNLTEINHSGSVYSFDYDIYGNASKISVGGQMLATYNYDSSNQLNYLLYGNGDRINYTYDSKGNITSISTQKNEDKTDTVIEYVYLYNDDGTLLSYTDNVNGTVTSYSDDGCKIIIPAANNEDTDKVIYSTVSIENETDVSLFEYTYQKTENLDLYDVETGQTTKSMKYTLPIVSHDSIATANSFTVNDYFGRTISSKFNFNTENNISDVTEFPIPTENISSFEYCLTNEYEYITDGDITTNLIKSFTTTIESLLFEKGSNECVQKEKLQSLKTSYEYDAAGRISKIYQDDLLESVYKYDEAGQLTEELYLIEENKEAKYTVIRYTYNSGGNVTSKCYYEAHFNNDTNDFVYSEMLYEDEYSYDNSQWGDLLTKYNGNNIPYDANGNPLFCIGTDLLGDGNIYSELEWNGRLLTSARTYPDSQNGTVFQIDYSYNASGQRTEKKKYMYDNNLDEFVLFQTTEYIWEGNCLNGYRINNYSENELVASIVANPLYDSNQEMIGVAFKTTNYSVDEETGEKVSGTIDNLFYFVKDAQGNILSYYNPITDIELNFEYDCHGKISKYELGGESAERLRDVISSVDTGYIGIDISIILGAAFTLGFMTALYMDYFEFTYRNYIYDKETGLYYNQSRYYSPDWGRFLNADDPQLTDTGTGVPNANNMFAYCENDSVNNVDPLGYAYISNKSLRTALKSLLISFGLNPLSGVAVVCLRCGLTALKNYIIVKATIISAKLGALVNLALSVIAAALAIAISGFSAKTIANALIQGKGISITWARTQGGRVYGLSVTVK